MASISKRRDGYLVRVSVFDPTTGKHKNISKQVNGNKKKAEQVGREMETEKDQGLLKPGKPQTVAEYSAIWLEAVKPTLAYNTFRGYRTNIDKHINPYIGKVRLKELTPSHVRTWIGQLQAHGYAPNTIRYARAVLRPMLKHAQEDGLVVRNVATSVKTPKIERVKLLILDSTQLRLLVEEATKTRILPAIVLGALCGLRRGEISGLGWGSVDLQRGQLTVDRTLQRHKGKGLVVQTPKTEGSRRVVAIPSTAVDLLRKWKVRQAEERLAAGPAWRGGDWVVTTLDGGPMDPAELSRYVTLLIRELGLPRLTLHGLRHTYASLSLYAGIDVKRVQASLGHATAAFTLDVYGHVTAGGLKDAAAQLDQAIFGK